MHFQVKFCRTTPTRGAERRVSGAMASSLHQTPDRGREARRAGRGALAPLAAPLAPLRRCTTALRPTDPGRPFGTPPDVPAALLPEPDQSEQGHGQGRGDDWLRGRSVALAGVRGWTGSHGEGFHPPHPPQGRTPDGAHCTRKPPGGWSPGGRIVNLGTLWQVRQTLLTGAAARPNTRSRSALTASRSPP